MINLKNELRAYLKVVLVITLILVFLCLSFFISCLVLSRWKRKRLQSQWIGFFSKMGLKILNVRPNWIRKSDSPNADHQGAELIVSNHLSYVDILVIAAHRPVCFVTSQEMREAPFIGTIVELGGCLFVERRNKKNLSKEVEDITEGLLNGLSVCIFPEATSTNGEQVLRFRRPLYNAAVKSRSPVLPLCLNYKSINGEKLNPKNRDSVFWYGDMDFLPHLLDLARLKSVDLEISILESIPVADDSQDALLAEHSHKLVSNHFEPCLA